MQPRKWFHVYNFSKEPATSYGFCIGEDGIVKDAADVIYWAKGKHIDFIKSFFEDKNVQLISIDDLILNSNEDFPQNQKNG